MVGQITRIALLVIVHRIRKGYKQGGSAYGGQFGHGAGACATDDQVGIGKGLCGIFNERYQFCLDTSLGVSSPQCVDVCLPALMEHVRAAVRRQQCKRLGHGLVEGARTQAAAHHPQAQRAAAVLQACNWAGLLQEGLAQGIADPLDLAAAIATGAGRRGQHIGIGGEYLSRKRHEPTVGHAGDRILFMQQERDAGQGRCQSGRSGDVAAHADDHLRTHAPQHGPALEKSLE